MKNDCNVIRDLMPLVIDGAASQESAELVETHVAQCEPCAEVYEELKGEIHEDDRSKEQAAFDKAARRLRQRRRLLPVLLALIVAIISAGTAWSAAPKYTKDALPMQDVFVQLVRLPESDSVILVIQPRDQHQAVGFSIEYIWEGDQLKHLLTVTNPLGNDLPSYRQLLDIYRFQDGVLLDVIGSRVETPVATVAWTDGSGETVIYRAGDTIPLASEELVQYMKVKALHDNSNFVLSGKRYETLQADLERLEALVPEFHPE